MSIKRAFLDKDDNLFITDTNNVLYLYRDDYFHPFVRIMENIRLCFNILDKYFVWYQRNLMVFDYDLTVSDAFNDETTDSVFLSKTIDQLDYLFPLRFLITLENGEMWLYHFNDDLDEYMMIPLSYNFHLLTGGLHTNATQTYEEFKVIGNLILAYSKDLVFIFAIRKPIECIYLTTIYLKYQLFDSIVGLNSKQNAFVMKNGHLFTIDMNNTLSNWRVKSVAQVYIQLKPNLYGESLVSLYGIELIKSKHELICICTPNRHSTISTLLTHVPLIKLAQEETIKGEIKTTFEIPTAEIDIISGHTITIITSEHKVYVLTDTLKEIELNETNISYNTLIEARPEKSLVPLTIDIDVSRSVKEQLINIIPAIYRLNNDLDINFEQVNADRTVKSYGDGVSRQIFSLLRKELDEILATKFAGCMNNTKLELYDLGGLLYVCNRDGSERFFHLHPYFFYTILSLKKCKHTDEDADIRYLLKVFKPTDYQSFYQQYLTYKEDPTKLALVDPDMSTYQHYAQYIFSSDLSAEEVAAYNEFVRGFYTFLARNDYFDFLQTLPIFYYIKLLVADEYFNADLSVNLDEISSLSNSEFIKGNELFKKLFFQLPQEQKAIFVQNITGSRYYCHEIGVWFAYRDPEAGSTVIVRGVSDEQEIEDGDDIEDQFDTLDIDDIMELEKNKNLMYRISTCSASLYIFVKPTEDNMRQILDTLIIEDVEMKN